MALLRLLLARPLGYLGILGPRARTERLLGELRASSSSFVPDTLAKLCAPVGLDLGAEAPETIALSILAEIQCLLSGRAPGHLRDRVAAIHG